MNPTSNLFLAILAMDAYNRVGGNVTTKRLGVATTVLVNVSASISAYDPTALWAASKNSGLAALWTISSRQRRERRNKHLPR